MTTICWDSRTGIIAADRRASNECGGRRTATKLWRCGDYAYGACGALASAQIVRDWVDAGMPQEKPSLEETDGVMGLLVNLKTGKAFVIESGKRLVMTPIEDPFLATGSGRDYAMAAMHLGKTAREAVEIAAVFDVFTGDGVDSFEVM